MSTTYSQNNRCFEKLLSTKIFYLNSSLTKFVLIGISVYDLSLKIVIAGKNGFCVILSEKEWKNLRKYQGVIANYFYCPGVDTSTVKCENIMLNFEKIKEFPILKIGKEGSNYVYLGQETVDNLWQLKDVLDYRISMIKGQGFENYFNVFQTNISIQVGDLLTNVYNALNPNQNPNSENVSTMLEFLMLYPTELENRLRKNGTKRNYYEEIGEY